MEPHVNWTDLKCDHCGNPATHVLVVEELYLDDDDPLIQMALCDNCHYLMFVGTLWVHKDPTWDATPDRPQKNVSETDPEPH